MKVEYVRPFVEAAAEVIRSELGTEVRRGDLALDRNNLTTREVTVLIGMTGQIEGTVLFGVDESVANHIVEVILGEPKDAFDEVSESAVAELGNMISGRAAMIFEEQGFACTISPPNLILGSGVRLSCAGMTRLIIPLVTDLGDVELAVALRERMR